MTAPDRFDAIHALLLSPFVAVVLLALYAAVAYVALVSRPTDPRDLVARAREEKRP